ncbi:MAG TPA: hypothetical protein VMH83_02250 [Candidatus Acidoferrum sp.]|nr:hypothetical protein [Candidatus Acidoferrum sp.]
MKTPARLCLALLTALAAMTCAATEAGDYVSVSGTHLRQHGKPYYIAGTNLWYGAHLGSTGVGGNRPRLLKELDTLSALGINNLRVLAISEASDIPGAVKPATTNGFGHYDEQLLVGLDFLLSEMAKRGMTAVLYLNNYWQWSGGMSQYLAWVEGEPMKDPEVTGDYPAFITNSARFYRSDEANKQYRATVAMLLDRVNTITNTHYRDDPAIMAWQLANEPRPGVDSASDDDKQIYAQWIDDTAKYIHSLDSHHLVTTGSEGLKGSANDGALYLKVHSSPYIDYVDFHLWPRNWGWYRPERPDKSWDETARRSLDYLQWHLEAAERLHKPMVLDEFGLDRDWGFLAPNTPTQFRDRFYRLVLNYLYDNAKAGGAAAGSNFWTWSGAGRPRDSTYQWQRGDDLTGDPPQERQGLNGVYDSDRSTLQLIKQQAQQLRALANKDTKP